MKKPKIFNILVLWTGIFGLLSNSFRGFDKIAFYLSEGMFWRRIVSEQNISILSFSHNEQTFPTFGWNSLGGVVKTAFLVFLTTFWGRKSFLWKNYKFLYLFQTLCEKNLAFWLFVSGWVVKAPHSVLVGKIERNVVEKIRFFH